MADDAAVRRFVERFALLLTESGMARMPARVFACVLAHDEGRLTAGELAERLGVSPAAISSAVRVLVPAGLLVREREPGERRDHYRLHEGLWYEMFAYRSGILRRYVEAVDEGVAVLGDGPAGRRLEETREFFAFLEQELPALLERWRAR